MRLLTLLSLFLCSTCMGITLSRKHNNTIPTGYNENTTIIVDVKSRAAFKRIHTISKNNKPVNPVVLDTTIMTFREYLAYVKKYHPVARQADLIIAEGEANLLRARGGFDPKIEVDYDRKKFKDIEYYDELNGVFKIPTWYGVEFKAGVERNEGQFLNPRMSVPDDGLYSAGVKVNLAQGLWINDRMATLRQAKLYQQQSLVDRDLMLNQVLYGASLAYFKWWRAQQEVEVYRTFLDNATERLRAVKTSYRLGDKAAIDTVEAGIAVQNRALNLEKSQLMFTKAKLELSNFLWVEEVPVELEEDVIAQPNVLGEVDAVLEIMGRTLDEFTIESHPKIRSLGLKIDQLEVYRRLKANKMLPKLTVDYNFITPDWNDGNSYNLNEYKAGITFSMPLFFRKERGELRLAQIKLDDARYDLGQNQVEIRNKVLAVFQELDSYDRQSILVIEAVGLYERMLAAEVRMFQLGDSSLFLINSREAKLIDAQLKALEIAELQLQSRAALFKSLAVLPENL